MAKPIAAKGKTQAEIFNDYDGFISKFEKKKTTDDCYTPPEVYDAVADYVSERFGIDRADMVRPFYPGGDYKAFEYPDGCCVVDNPPFSILAKIKRFYIERGIRFFLFAPSLTLLSGKDTMRLHHIVADLNVTYENGASVLTGFVTNLGTDIIAESCPEIHDRVQPICDAYAKRGKKSLPKYEYPDEIITAAKLQWMAGHGSALAIRRDDCMRITKLDAQNGKSIFGGGLLLSPAAAAERAAAERAAATKWQLSDRERALSAMLGGSA